MLIAAAPARSAAGPRAGGAAEGADAGAGLTETDGVEATGRVAEALGGDDVVTLTLGGGSVGGSAVTPARRRVDATDSAVGGLAARVGVTPPADVAG